MKNDAQSEEVLSTEGKGDTFAEVMQRNMSRRGLLKGGAAASAMLLAAPALSAKSASAQTTAVEPTLDFQPIGLSTEDRTIVSAGHNVDVLLKWGDPITANTPAFDAANQTAEAQSQQFGYNCDFVGFLPLPLGSRSADSGLLVVNHEYTNPELMFAGYSADNPTKQQADVELAAHGVSVVEIARNGSRKWGYNRSSRYNRRLTATSSMAVSGPAAGHDWLKTSADPTGTNVSGTLNNCAAGRTPWGTVLTAEENFQQYFGNLEKLPDGDVKKMHARYGVETKATERKWERFYPRFDVVQEPNEPFRHGWVVEVDPYDPTMTPVKRTALGRFRHEAATVVITPARRVVLYTGDDARFEYVYKFVSARSYSTTDRKANMGLLDEGTLYVAKFNADGSGQWLPLIHGQGGLTADKGFKSQAEVLINTRGAADLLGATKMDRPEDIETNPVTGKVYVVLTNNTQRGTDNRPGTDPANPRKENKHGHIVELTEAGNDHTATTFNWGIFILCGDPKDETTYFAGYPKVKVSTLSSPDNITFDNAGNLWISTDGQPGTLKMNDGLYAVPTEGPERGYVRQFFSGVPGGEVSGPEFTPDDTSLFIAVQHPGEGGTLDKPLSLWPDGTNIPRPSVVVVQSETGGRIGMSLSTATPEPPPTQVGMPKTGIPGVLGPLGVAAGIGAAAVGALIRLRTRQDGGNEDENPDKDQGENEAETS